MQDGERDMAARYFRHAVDSDWSPFDIDFAADRDTLADLGRRQFAQLRAAVAMFGAGEERVTEDLRPLATTVDGGTDQWFVASHIYEEAKHAAFFDRYWNTAVQPVEAERGLGPTSPTADKWFSDPYETVFDSTEAAMNALLERDTPRRRAEAFAHYHLTVEGVLGQTGFHAIEATFGPDTAGPSLPGLVDGFAAVRGDEARHVGYGLTRLVDLLESGAVDLSTVEATVSELADPVDAVVSEMGWKGVPGPDSDALLTVARRQRRRRLEQLAERDTDGGSVTGCTSR
ncbi:ribonucleoside-diphosphate reductase [Haloarcula salinisoli]|uniref:Ribonucleoside-diphosphate reductase n=1 Tax=Haloarcula salinisoli TaxID=2487746 RepID=A0A8J7YII1_9EURY|nr:ribonucleoside-diphosphate reductase [Halomicroarcula salinisoli]MBX0285189.1 ribonucleoside-diphosphate reductase [Halomicroarcula salinisoli]MBX0303334.1 ribonucleoside-diphosphate reductase [Halomicroarcula salinisoli]